MKNKQPSGQGQGATIKILQQDKRQSKFVVKVAVDFASFSCTAQESEEEGAGERLSTC